jgi:tRNA (guanine-N(7)-)-methyltransferase subunit TRM82
VVVAALSDRAFAVLTSEQDATSGARVYELLPPAVSAPAAPAKKRSKINGGGAEKDSAADDNVVKEGEAQETKSDPSADTKEEIQAVCSTEIGSHIWLAVSREDKTLSLYCVADVKFQEDVMQLQPVAIYNMPKRARCLVFHTLPSSTGADCHMIIAGDLSGDAFAYPVPSYDAIDLTAAAAAKPSSRRLLLGHTASMLTGMQVAPTNSGRQFILTADRDEKVRVSCFPETHIVHGYLLGHTAFVSAMDAVSGDGARPLCLTGSGDGTVRLWDYQTCKEVGMVPLVLQPPGGDSSNNDDLNVNDEGLREAALCKDDNNFDENEDESVEFDGDCGDDDFDEKCDGLIAVPLAVAMSSDAEYVVVAREGISSIDIHPIPDPDPAKNTSGLSSMFLSQLVSLHKKQTLQCPSQPLDVCLLSDGSVLVLAREPEYILHFRCIGSEFEDMTSTSPICSVLASVATSRSISMPITALEYNEDGTLKLQKKVDNKELDGDEAEGGESNAGNSGLHWNDKERKNTHRLANGRRRKRNCKGGGTGEEEVDP